MSVISYNGVYIPYGRTTQFKQEVMYDDQGRTDWYCTRFDIQVEGLLNFNYLSQIAPDLIQRNGVPFTQNPADIMQLIRYRLLRPRRTLSMKFNGQELIPQPQTVGLPGGNITNLGSVDAQNGPQPQSCNITQLTNVLFLITYHIIAHYWENNVLVVGDRTTTRNQAGSPVLYNRWSETVDIDEFNYTTRTREGKFVIRSDNSEGLIIDHYRQSMAILGVPPNFLRKSASYTVSPDGLGLQYRIVDGEVFKKPPTPAYRAEGKYVETTSLPGDSPFRIGHVSVTLRGSSTRNNQGQDTQANLIIAARAVATAKMKDVQGVDANSPLDLNYLQHMTLAVDMYENVVECQIKMLITPGTSRKFKIEDLRKTLTTTPFSVASYQPGYSERGTAGYLLQAAAYYDPNITKVKIDGATGQLSPQGTTWLEPGQAGVTQEK